MAASPAHALDKSEIALPEPAKRWSIDYSFDTSVGIGSFLRVGTLSSTYSYVASGLTLNPAYQWKINRQTISTSLKGEISFEWTVPDNADGRRFEWSDVSLGLALPDAWENQKQGLKFNVGLTLSLPCSRVSLLLHKYLDVGLGFSLTKKNPKVGASVSVSSSATKNFSRYPSVTMEPNAVLSNPLLFDRGNEGLMSGPITTGAVLYEWGWSNKIALSFSPPRVPWLGFSLALGLRNRWKYDVAPNQDALTAPNARAGRGRSDSTSGNFEISFGLPLHLGLALGLTSVQPLRTPDNREFYVPFFNFEGMENNFTNVYLGLSGSI